MIIALARKWGCGNVSDFFEVVLLFTSWKENLKYFGFLIHSCFITKCLLENAALLYVSLTCSHRSFLFLTPSCLAVPPVHIKKCSYFLDSSGITFIDQISISPELGVNDLLYVNPSVVVQHHADSLNI